MKIRNIFTTKYGEWCVFYKIKESSWKKLKVQKGYWYADPILLEYKDNIYLFTEAFKNSQQIGRLAISKLIDGEFTQPKEIIRKSYHLSYPCVFVYNDFVYMIPESSQNQTLELYKAIDQTLENWQLEKNLIENIECVDTTVFQYKSKMYLITYIQGNMEYITKVYLLDMDKLELNEVYSVNKKENVYRPAGKIFERDGAFFRPVQYNINSYGEKIRLMEINPDKNDWIGNVKDEYTIQTFGLCDMSKTHTYNKIQDVCVVDALHEYTTVLTPFYILRRKCHNFRFKIKNSLKKKV